MSFVLLIRFLVNIYAPLAQLVEQLTLNQWVQGSSPWRCTIYSSIAQSAERMTVNHDVTGSSPVRGAKKKASRKTCFFLSNPKDWYGITRRVYGIRRKATAWHQSSACILLRIDYIQHFVLIPYRRQAADFIHAYRRDFTSCIFVL